MKTSFTESIYVSGLDIYNFYTNDDINLDYKHFRISYV